MLEGFKYILRLESFAIPVFLYCFTKLLLPIKPNDNFLKKTLVLLARVILTVILLPVAILSLLLCAITFGIINTLARIKYGKRYVGYFDGADAVWSLENKPGKGVIHIIFHVEDKGPQTPAEMLEILRTDNAKAIKLHPRLQCIRESFLGYFYFVKPTELIDTSQFINYMEEYADTEECRKVIAAKMASPMPLNDAFMWEAAMGRKPVEYQPGRFGYPLLIRYHHSSMDGVTLTVLLVTSYVQDGVNVMKTAFDELKSILTKKHQNKVQSDFTTMWKQLWSLLTRDYYLHYNMLSGSDDVNSLHQPTTSKKILTVSKSDDDDLIGKIKTIKRKLQNVSFNDVLLGCLAASFTEHFVLKDGDNHPKTILTANPYFLKALDFNELLTIKENKPVTNLGNKFTVGHIKLPINVDFLKDPKQFVYALHKESESLKNSLDFQMVYWLLNIITTIVPREVSLKLTDFYDPTAIVSNMPGVCNIVFRNGYKILDAAYTSHHYMNVGTTVTIYAFERSMRIASYVDENNIEEKQEVQLLGDNVFKYINMIYNSLE